MSVKPVKHVSVSNHDIMVTTTNTNTIIIITLIMIMIMIIIIVTFTHVWGAPGHLSTKFHNGISLMTAA